MNSSDDWVQHNLQRQRHLLEERQKQRRLQQNAVVSSQQGVLDVDMSPTGNLGSYSFLEKSAPVVPPRMASSRSSTALSAPRVITVKGVTPPNGQKHGASTENLNSTKPPSSISSTSKNSYTSSSTLSVNKQPEGLDVKALSIEAISENGDVDGSETVRPWEDNLETNVIDDKETKMDFSEIMGNIDKFVFEPVRQHHTLRCRITRCKKGMDKGMFPIYYLHLERDDGNSNKNIFLLAARRRKKSATANYLLSTDATNLSRSGDSFVAKVRCNAVGTMFTVYDNGANPKKSAVIGDQTTRRELCAIIYETNVFGFKGPRKMTIVIPQIDKDKGTQRPFRPIHEADSIVERYKSHRLEDMCLLNNKQPQWNEETQSYVLNFHGRVTQASVKNFQVIHLTDPDYIVMQFGRVSDEVFTMDFRYPLSPVQAFGIAMSSFHGKIACE